MGNLNRTVHRARETIGLLQWRIQSFGLRGATWRARGRESITGVWGLRPQRGPGAEPLVRGSGGRRRSPLKLKSFFHWNVQRRGYSRHFSCSVGVVDGDSGQGDYGLGRSWLVLCVAFGQPTKVSFPVYLLPNDNVCRHFFRGDHFHLPCLIPVSYTHLTLPTNREV